MSYFKCPRCGANLIPYFLNGVRVHMHAKWYAGGCSFQALSKELYAKSKKAGSITAAKRRLRESFRLATESNAVWYAFMDSQDMKNAPKL